jgi:hypothetical protein
MKIQPLIETPETRRTKQRMSITRVQYICFGIAIAALAGSLDPWWKSGHVAALFCVAGLALGIWKARTCRAGRRTTTVSNPIVIPEV